MFWKVSLSLMIFAPFIVDGADAFSSLSIGHREYKGIGYDDGYSSAALFLAANPGCSSIFLDLRGHVFNQGNFAANGGLGARIPFKDWLFGANAFYDFRDERRCLRSDFNEKASYFHRVGLGLEAFYSCWELRANGYLPVGNKKRIGKEYFSHFSQNRAYKSQKALSALPSIDLEVGGNFSFFEGSPLSIYMAVLPYYLFGQGHSFGNAAGGKAKLQVTFNHLFGIEGCISYDRIYHTRVQGAVTLSIPINFFGASCDSSSSICLPSCIPQRNRSVRREEIIPIQKWKKSSTINNPINNEPYNFLFIKNTELGRGLGTFEDPYSALAVAEFNSAPNDILYVLYGDNTTTNMDIGVTLQEGQKLIGSAASFNLGNSFIPALTPTLFPSLSNSSGTAINLATHNEVAGLNIINSDVGIASSSSDQSYFSIHDMLINAVTNGIVLNLDNQSYAEILNSSITNANALTYAIDITLANQSSIMISNNSVSNNSSVMAVSLQSTGGYAIVKDNLIDQRFDVILQLGGASTTLKALGNAGANPLLTTYNFQNSAGASSFLIEIPRPTSVQSTNEAIFESLNDGDLNIVGGATFVPLSGS